MKNIYESSNPVPQKGDKIQIIAVNSSYAWPWKVGDIVNVVDGKADYWGKPGFCTFVIRENHHGEKKVRRVWSGVRSYCWKIVERDGKPYGTGEDDNGDLNIPSDDFKNACFQLAFEKAMSNPQLTGWLFDGTYKGTAHNIVYFANILAEEMVAISKNGNDDKD